MAERTHNHTRWRNGNDPWSPCPPSCPAGPGEDGPPYMLANTPEELERAKRVAFRQLDAEAARLAGPGEGVRAEVREQIAEALHVTGTRPGFAEQDAWTRWTTLTDAVLAVPAVAEALALRGRVEALVARWDGDGYLGYMIEDVRRALGEDGQ